MVNLGALRGERINMDNYFIVTTPGLETITALELQGLGISPLETEPGGILVKGELATFTPSTCTSAPPAGFSPAWGIIFRATTFPGLKLRLVALPWERFIISRAAHLPACHLPSLPLVSFRCRCPDTLKCSRETTGNSFPADTCL